MNRGQKIIISVLAIIFLIVIFYFTTEYISATTGYAVKGELTPEQLAKCLTENGVRMYGSMYCPHCAEQKELFGESFALINYTECANPDNANACSNLQGVPAWIIKGNIYYGKQELLKLRKLSGC